MKAPDTSLYTPLHNATTDELLAERFEAAKLHQDFFAWHEFLAREKEVTP